VNAANDFQNGFVQLFRLCANARLDNGAIAAARASVTGGCSLRATNTAVFDTPCHAISKSAYSRGKTQRNSVFFDDAIASLCWGRFSTLAQSRDPNHTEFQLLTSLFGMDGECRIEIIPILN
jgi:hypothetical protein